MADHGGSFWPFNSLITVDDRNVESVERDCKVVYVLICVFSHLVLYIVFVVGFWYVFL